MKISFDFDSTLSTERIQKLAKKFIDEGHDVWITTSRFSNTNEIVKTAPWIIEQNQLLFDLAEELGIVKEKIQFTCMHDKCDFLEGFDMHFDDDYIEIEMIEQNLPSCVGILINTPYIYNS